MALPSFIRRSWPGLPVFIAMAAYAWMGSGGTFVGAGDAATAFALGALLFVIGVVKRQWPVPDRGLVAVAILFIALCWVSELWTIAPTRTTRGALQITFVFTGALILLGEAKYLEAGSHYIFRATMAGASLGAVLALIDLLTDFPIMRQLLPHDATEMAAGGKMDRGLIYLVFLAWPLIAYSWQAGFRAWTCLFGALVMAVIALSWGVTAQLSLAVGLIAFALSFISPMLVACALAVGSAIAASLTPILALDFGQSLLPWAARIKPSAVHRLEIWDYMSRRALERPLTGWGWWTAHALPIRPDELARYKYVTPSGSPHPHGNWVQLWVETGVFGVAIGLAFVLLVLWRVWKLPRTHRPFALACCASVFIIALASFDLATDSWWAVLAATGLLFSILPRPAGAPDA
jgi:hypothetical protein